MDALEQMLIEKYNVPPDQAKNFARRIHEGSIQQGAGLQTEAYTPVANAEIARMDRLRQNAIMFTDLAKRKANGEQLAPKEEAWYGQVRKLHDAAIRSKASEAMQFDQAQANHTAINEIARMGNMQDISRQGGFQQGWQPTTQPGVSARPAQTQQQYAQEQQSQLNSRRSLVPSGQDQAVAAQAQLASRQDLIPHQSAQAAQAQADMQARLALFFSQPTPPSNGMIDNYPTLFKGGK